MNLSGTLNATRALLKPQLVLPQIVVPTFDKIPIPITSPGWPDIRAVVLDKDNCFAVKHTAHVYGPYKEYFDRLRSAYTGNHLLIVSNRAGTNDYLEEASILERETGVKVLKHSTKKPGCGADILHHFQNCGDVDVTQPDQIAVVGDRLFTDIMLANLMGSLGVWVREGVEPVNGMFARLEKMLPDRLGQMGYRAPQPGMKA